MTHPSFEDATPASATSPTPTRWRTRTTRPARRTTTARRTPAGRTTRTAPFHEAPDPNGGFPGAQQHDIGVVWAAGAGGQKTSVHRGLDLVIACATTRQRRGVRPAGPSRATSTSGTPSGPRWSPWTPRTRATPRRSARRTRQHLRARPARAVVPAGAGTRVHAGRRAAAGARSRRRLPAARSGWPRPLRRPPPAGLPADRSRRSRRWSPAGSRCSAPRPCGGGRAPTA